MLTNMWKWCWFIGVVFTLTGCELVEPEIPEPSGRWKDAYYSEVAYFSCGLEDSCQFITCDDHKKSTITPEEIVLSELTHIVMFGDFRNTFPDKYKYF